MLVKLITLVVRDSWGNVGTGVVSDWGDSVVLCGMLDKDSKWVSQFESEAHHASSWAVKHKLELVVHEVELNFATRAVVGWKETRSCELIRKQVHVKQADVDAVRVSLWNQGESTLVESKSAVRGWHTMFLVSERLVDVVLRDMATDGIGVLVRDNK